jgi:hypothetical protein
MVKHIWGHLVLIFGAVTGLLPQYVRCDEMTVLDRPRSRIFKHGSDFDIYSIQFGEDAIRMTPSYLSFTTTNYCNSNSQVIQYII